MVWPKAFVLASVITGSSAHRVNEQRLLDRTWVDFSTKDEVNPMEGAASCVWPGDLASRYTDQFVVGTGATACVWIAKDNDIPVAVKVAKQNGKLSEWQKECNDMQQMRLAACRKGGESQQLAENFLPTCLEVGNTGAGSFYVMQAAGTKGISDFAKGIKHQVTVQKKVFAQVVAAVYSMHGIDYTHNDLHGHNIVLNGEDVALIDFGEIKGHHRGLGYKHDVNSIWRWAAVLGNCPKTAQYPRLMKSFFSKKSKDELTQRSQALIKCMKNKWKADAEFLEVFELALKDAIKITEDQHVEELYKTKFIQDNLPKLQNVYPWDGNGKCSASGLEKKKQAEIKPPATMSGRPGKGDRVKDKMSKKCGEIVVDEGGFMPYQIKYDDGGKSRFLREVQVAWASECL